MKTIEIILIILIFSSLILLVCANNKRSSDYFVSENHKKYNPSDLNPDDLYLSNEMHVPVKYQNVVDELVLNKGTIAPNEIVTIGINYAKRYAGHDQRLIVTPNYSSRCGDLGGPKTAYITKNTPRNTTFVALQPSECALTIRQN